MEKGMEKEKNIIKMKKCKKWRNKIWGWIFKRFKKWERKRILKFEGEYLSGKDGMERDINIIIK